MAALLIAGGAIVWIVLGVVGAGALARANQTRGARRVPAIERRIGFVYLSGAVLGPLSPIAAAFAFGLFRIADTADARAAERAKAEKFASRRTAREEDRSAP